MFKECKSLIKFDIYDSYKDIENNPNDTFIEPEYFLLDKYFAKGININSSEKNSENKTYSYYSVISEKKDEEQDKSTISDLVSNLPMNQKNIILLGKCFVIVYHYNTYQIYLIGILVMHLILVECLLIVFL